MATGFIARDCRALRLGSALLLGLSALAAGAAEVTYVGAIGDKAAVLVIDGAAPRTVRIGQVVQGVKLLSLDAERVVIEEDGAKRTLYRGQHSQASSGGRQSTVLSADGGGHYLADGAINGKPIRFVVDTGATMVAIPAADAVRLGIDYRSGRQGTTRTAGGTVPVFRIQFATVKVGGIELHAVEGLVIERGLDVALLGMSFLSRVEIRNEGQTMTLIRRF